MDYKQLIINWHLKASEEDYFSKFIFEYLAFIAYIKTERYTPPNPETTYLDREVIQKLKQDSDLKARYLTVVKNSNFLSSAWQEITIELERQPLGNVSRHPRQASEIQWWNCSHDKLGQKTTEERALTCGVIHSPDDWENMVEFWYSIRNNLFHGAKDPAAERDKIAVRIGYITLRPLVDLFIQ